MTFRDSIREISPPWLTEAVSGGILYAIGLMIDAQEQWRIEGTKARFPGNNPGSLGLIGNDRQIERGPNEDPDSYGSRLRLAVDTWKGAGNAFTLLPQLAAFFLPDDPPPMRLVSNAAVWHELTAGVVTKTVVSPPNWQWDQYAATPRWWRGWVIVDSSAGPWHPDYWGTTNPDGSPATWGDGGTWGSDIPYNYAITLVKIVRKWESANTTATLIMTFDASLFEVADAPAANPNYPTNDFSTPATRTTVAAIFSGDIKAE